MYTLLEQNEFNEEPKRIRKNTSFSVRFRVDERKNKSGGLSTTISQAFIERAKELKCSYIHFYVDELYKEVHLELCEYPRTLDFLAIKRNNGAYRKIIYTRLLLKSLQEKTSGHFELMKTYSFKENPNKPHDFIYYYGSLKPKEK